MVTALHGTGHAKPRSASLSCGDQKNAAHVLNVEKTHAACEGVVPRFATFTLRDEVDTLDSPLSQNGPRIGKESGRDVQNVEQLEVVPFPRLERSTPCMESGTSAAATAHIPENLDPKDRVLVEEVADGVKGKNKVGVSNMKFWKRQAREVSLTHGCGSAMEGVG
jgi:hypothetical protein